MNVRQRIAAGVVSVGLAASGTLIAGGGTAWASDPGACAANGRSTPVLNETEFVCGLWTGNVPVYGDSWSTSGVVGYLNVGGRANWFLYECTAGASNELYVDGYHNDWWAFTEADNGKWGWVNEVYFSGGANDQGSGVLPNETPCGGGSTIPQ